MKRRLIILSIAVAIMCLGVFVVYSYTFNEYIEKNKEVVKYDEAWNSLVASVLNKTSFVLKIDGKEYTSSGNQIYMDDNRSIMLDSKYLTEAFDCATNLYSDTTLKIEKADKAISMKINRNSLVVDGIKSEMKSPVVTKGSSVYVPIEEVCNSLGYSYVWDKAAGSAIVNNNSTEQRVLPYKYSYETARRAPGVRSQGNLGTCWAFAANTALESTLLPEEDFDFSEDHMSLNSHYVVSQYDGGDSSMAIAYYTAWQGPVLEKDDPYADGITNSNLKPVKHIQEIQVTEGKDIEYIKKMVFKYGGVESSLYMDGESYNMQYSSCYSADNNAYCYIGTATSNHDVVIIGWDDNYSKNNFKIKPEGDGAFLCRNSWGNEFGDNGNFYVSYFDSNLGMHNVVYTRVEDVNNYDNIYQSDLCGQTGMIGYGKEDAYFANVYTAESHEKISAVGFYTVGKDTDYSVYVVKQFKYAKDLEKPGDEVASGKITNMGYYTIDLKSEVLVEKGEKYAIVVKINTKNVTRPIAIEYANSYATSKVDISDGEGYISYKGQNWENIESRHNSNVCLKVYTKNVR